MMMVQHNATKLCWILSTCPVLNKHQLYMMNDHVVLCGPKIHCMIITSLFL